MEGQLNHVLDDIKKGMKQKLAGRVSTEDGPLNMKLDTLIRQHLSKTTMLLLTSIYRMDFVVRKVRISGEINIT